MKLMIPIVGLLCLTLASCASDTNTIKIPNQSTEAANVNVNMGLYYLTEKGNVTSAKEKLLKAQAQAPKSPLVWTALAYFEEKTGNSDLADTYYKKAIRLNPSSGSSHNNYGTFLCRHGKYLSSIDYFIKAAEDQNYLNVASAYKNAGHCAMKIPDVDLARRYFALADARSMV